MDGLGIRPAMLEVGERLASYGYFVLMPDVFYRPGQYEDKYFDPASPANVMSDAAAYLDFIAAQPDVKAGKVGTTGYCMGGLMSLTAAGTYPGRIAASASFHGGRLASDAPGVRSELRKPTGESSPAPRRSRRS